MELHKIRKQINEYVLLNSKTIKLHMKYENIITEIIKFYYFGNSLLTAHSNTIYTLAVNTKFLSVVKSTSHRVYTENNLRN
jgi:NifU-like protein involved in Fe-S cluster formation